jgi:tetratricopeptide (TPR) repeat protein
LPDDTQNSGSPEESNDSGLNLSQDELDKLLGEVDGKSGGGDDAAPTLSQDELDKLLGGGEDDASSNDATSPTLSQDELDKLLGGGEDDASSDDAASPALSQDELDKLLGEEVNNASPASSGAPLLDQSELDALVLKSNEEDVPVEEPSATEAAGDDVPLNGAENDDTPLDNVDLDDVIGEVEEIETEATLDDKKPAPEAEAEVASASSDVGSENVAAAGAAPEDEQGIDQDLIDSLISDAHVDEAKTDAPEVLEKDSEIALSDEDWGDSTEAEAPEDESSNVIIITEERRRFRLPSLRISFPGVGEGLPKIAASLLFGIACSLITFSWLVLNQDRLMVADEVVTGEDIIQRAVASAEGLVGDGLYERASMELEDAIASAPAASNRDDAEYWHIKSQYLKLGDAPDALAAEALLSTMGDFASESPDHPRVTEVMRWRGDVYDRTGIPLAALGVYNDLLTNYIAPLDGDRVLLAAGKSSLELDRPQQAAEYLRRLREEYPASALSDEAGLYQADAYRALGSPEKAAVVYRQIAVSNPAERIGGQAYARLAQMSFDDGEYDTSIELLETRLATATTTDGNEDAYLLLARSLRATGQHEESERVLRELTQFFPENPRTAEALVELSQVMEARGHRPEASNIARQAAQRFPESSAALENAAVFLAQAGDERGAAESLLQADSVGAENPGLLLSAARHFAETGETKEAQRTYEQLLESYGNSPEAFEGRIELAGIYFDQGKIQKSIDWLEDLAAVHEDGPGSVPVLLALGEQYSSLGLHDRAAKSQREIVAIAGEPAVLADAAAALLEGSDVETGLEAAHRVDVDRLPDPLAYRFLRAHGLALRTVDGRRALAQLERAYHNYPSERQPADTLDLLESYLVADRTVAARALVMDLEESSKTDISVAPVLTKAAVMWGDNLFERRVFRAAVDAYSLADSDLVEEDDPLRNWARMQRANALLQLRDVSNSAPLLADVSESGSLWSEDAAMRQSYAEIERRLAHEEPLSPNGD